MTESLSKSPSPRIGTHSTLSDQSPTEPVVRVDVWLCAQFCFIGVVALLGWNFILGELGVLIDAFGAPYGTWVSMCYSLLINAGQLLLVFIGNKFRFAPRFDVGCIGMGTSQILIAIVAVTWARSSQTAGFVMGCILIGVFGFSNAMMESSMFGLAAMCEARCMTWIMVGEGLAGIVQLPLNLLVKVVLESMNISNVPYTKLVVFFAISMLINYSIVPVFRWCTMKHPYMQHVFAVERGREKFSLSQSLQRPLRSILRDTLPQAFNAWINFVVTFVVFPWLVFRMPPSNLSVADFGAYVVYTFQVFDTIGRLAPSLSIRLGKRAVRWATLSRVIFIPIFFLCVHVNVPPFNQDWFRFVVMALLALTNGVCITWIMIHGPTQVPEDRQEEQEVAGYTMAFALINGIFIGSLLATLIEAVGPY
ncbi:solute carrier 29 (nucleoside transporters), member [Perkinsus olseni]|uniref:Solute carrier 29 (Nucleoside transporters), member n=1 Tax=Perkinsus olseni TaxID=32597 RepID=A0A7J6M9W7_PEROL|nr:solute carrier 29 (nucleoside transporters), member [Perkinsus olseni]KAF4673829.1 solute carrier 29 (nucleoside transporters), member [Perkinsus olseni]